MFPRIDKGPVEYALKVHHAFNTEHQRPCVRFHFETTAEFTHFRYRISVDQRATKGGLLFALRGLRAGGLTMPGTGTAQADIDLFDLAGTYHVEVLKPGDVRTAFVIDIGADHIRLLDAPAEEGSFMIVETA
jgi:hypothetical protein